MQPRRSAVIIALLILVVLGLSAAIVWIGSLPANHKVPTQTSTTAKTPWTASPTPASQKTLQDRRATADASAIRAATRLPSRTPTDAQPLIVPAPGVTPRVPDPSKRYARVRCDNPNIWSLPVVDEQFHFNALFGIQPVGSLYYDGLLRLKLITPMPTITPTATSVVTPTDTPTPIVSATPNLSVTATITPGVMHPGVDLATGSDAPVYAVANGQVAEISYNDLYGMHVILKVKGYQVLYGHLNDILVEEGQSVNCGQLLGISGASGRYQTGPHLHFEVRKNGQAIDPLPLLQQSARAALPRDLKAQMALDLLQQTGNAKP